jgi:hypothetical protein
MALSRDDGVIPFRVQRVLRWVDAVRKGKADRNIINIASEFVPGGSIGPVWKP